MLGDGCYMSVSGRKFTHVSPADDLAAESDGSLRHGFVNGAVYAMALSSANRKVISGNLYARLPGHVAGSCQVFNSEMKRQTKTDADERAYDSDVFVSCDSSDWEGHSRKTAVPIIEVMQPSTERTDRTAKFEAYRHNPSLIECVLLSKVQLSWICPGSGLEASGNSSSATTRTRWKAWI